MILVPGREDYRVNINILRATENNSEWEEVEGLM